MGTKYGGLQDEVIRKRYVPGPGSYEHKDSNKTIPSMKFGSGMRSDFATENPTAKIVPGPGNYSGNFENVTKAAPKIGFGSEKRASMALDKKTPGPGNYKWTE